MTAQIKSLLGSLIVLCFLISAPAGCSRKDPAFVSTTTTKELQQVVDDAKFAITERNYRINIDLHIGKAIAERQRSGFPDYEVILFCNLSYAQEMLEIAPDFVRYCPQRLAIYDDGEKRIITASLIPENTPDKKLNQVTGRVNALMAEIVEFAARDWPEVEE